MIRSEGKNCMLNDDQEAACQTQLRACIRKTGKTVLNLRIQSFGCSCWKKARKMGGSEIEVS